MSLKILLNRLFILGIVGATVVTSAPLASADILSLLDSCCGCGPAYKHCAEGPPDICFKHTCPKPVCDPCSMHDWGYYQNSWHPWPWTPNFSHCCDPTPIGAAKPTPLPPGKAAEQGANEQ